MEDELFPLLILIYIISRYRQVNNNKGCVVKPQIRIVRPHPQLSPQKLLKNRD